jgi:dolichol-phosphate mannosyltransferase
MKGSSDPRRRALVTGASGFVGAVLVRRLVEEGHDVHAVSRRKDAWRLRGIAAPVHAVDLADERSLSDLVETVRPEWIFHLAANGAYSWQRELPAMIETNVLGTMNLVEACLRSGFEALVNTGSSSEYGFTDHAPAEDEAPSPNSDYAVTKLTATLYCRAAALRRNAHIPTLRLYSVYGPFEEPARLVPTLAMEGRAGRLPPVVSPGVARDFVYVDDAVEAFLLAARHRGDDPGAIYNVGTGRQTTIAEAVEVARKLLRVSVEPRFGSMPNRSWDTNCWVANPEKIEREIGWKPRTGFEEGFGRFVEWMEEDRARLERYNDARRDRI